MRPFHDITLTTNRLLLRPLVPADAEPLFAVFSDPRVMRYWSSKPWTDVSRAVESIASDQAAMLAGQYLRVGIEIRSTSEFIGTCTLYDFSAQCRRAELGYAMSSLFWGHGYMQEALTALLDYAFTELDLHRVEADVDPRNVPSSTLLERLGFLKEGHLRGRWIVEGEVSDTSLYGLLQSDWQARPHHEAPRANA